MISEDTFVSVEFELPELNRKKYQLKVNGKEVESRIFAEQKSSLDLEVFYDGQVIYSSKGLGIPEDRTFRFHFVEVLGRGIINLRESQRHLIMVTVVDDFEEKKILLRGMEGHPNGVVLEDKTSYILNQEEVQQGNLSLEIYQADQMIWSDKVHPETNKTLITLVGNPVDGLLPLSPPSEEMRKQLVDQYDTWISFLYSKKDYPEIETLVVELAPNHYFVDPEMIDELQEGKEPIVIELLPDKPSAFTLFNSFEEGGRLCIYKMYDKAKPEEPLLIAGDWGIVFWTDEWGYNEQGEDDYKFRTYKLVPEDSDELSPDTPAFTFPFPLFKIAYSFP